MHQETDALHSLIMEGWMVIMSLPSELPLELMGIISSQPLNHPAAHFPLMMYTALPRESVLSRYTLRAVLKRMSHGRLAGVCADTAQALQTPPVMIPLEKPDTAIQLLGHILYREAG